MKVLWFTHMPANASGYLGYDINRCGWITSLERKLKEDGRIKLAVAFYHDKDIDPFTLEGVKYYPIYRELENPISKWVFRLRGSIERVEDLAKYIQVIEDYEPNIIHGTESPFGIVIPHLSKPVVISIQGNLTVYNKKFFSGFSKLDVLKNWNLGDIFRLKHLLFHKLSFQKKAKRERKILEYAKFIIGRTDWDKRVASVLARGANYYHCDEILRSRFYKSQWQPQKGDSERVILSTIGDNIYKGFETVWEALEILSQIDNVIWKIAGISPKSQIVRIAKLKYNRNLPNNLHLLGSVNAERLIKELLNSDLYVHPSHIENSSNSICEAMILGMPIIATYSGGTGSLLSDQKDGILIQDGDPYSLAGAILEIFDDYDQAIKYGKSARKIALYRHNQEKITENLIQIYERIQNNYN